MNKLARTARLLRGLRCGFAEITKPNARTPVRRERLQFSKQRLVDFGELPHGEIPEALRAVRPQGYHKLGNDVRVVSESWVGGQPSYEYRYSASLS